MHTNQPLYVSAHSDLCSIHTNVENMDHSCHPFQNCNIGFPSYFNTYVTWIPYIDILISSPKIVELNSQFEFQQVTTGIHLRCSIIRIFSILIHPKFVKFILCGNRRWIEKANSFFVIHLNAVVITFRFLWPEMLPLENVHNLLTIWRGSRICENYNFYTSFLICKQHLLGVNYESSLLCFTIDIKIRNIDLSQYVLYLWHGH